MEGKKVQTSDNTIITSDKNIQTAEEIVIRKEEYMNYPCFFCDFGILSEEQLLEHRLKCHVTAKTFSLTKCKIHPPNESCSVSFSLPVEFPPPKLHHHLPYVKTSLSHLPKCTTCGWIAKSGTDVMNHMRIVHNEIKKSF